MPWPDDVRAIEDAERAIESLESFASRVEDHERPGDLGQLLGYDAIAKSILALAKVNNRIAGVVGS